MQQQSESYFKHWSEYDLHQQVDLSKSDVKRFINNQLFTIKRQTFFSQPENFRVDFQEPWNRDIRNSLLCRTIDQICIKFLISKQEACDVLFRLDYSSIQENQTIIMKSEGLIEQDLLEWLLLCNNHYHVDGDYFNSSSPWIHSSVWTALNLPEQENGNLSRNKLINDLKLKVFQQHSSSEKTRYRKHLEKFSQKLVYFQNVFYTEADNLRTFFSNKEYSKFFRAIHNKLDYEDFTFDSSESFERVLVCFILETGRVGVIDISLDQRLEHLQNLTETELSTLISKTYEHWELIINKSKSYNEIWSIISGKRIQKYLDFGDEVRYLSNYQLTKEESPNITYVSKTLSKDYNNMTTTKEHLTYLGGSVSEVFQQAFKMAAAKGVNDISGGIVKNMAKKAGVPEFVLDTEVVNLSLEIVAPLFVMTLCEVFKDKIPGSETIKEGCQFAFQATAYKKALPLFEKLRPHLAEITHKAQQIVDAEVVETEIHEKEKELSGQV